MLCLRCRCRFASGDDLAKTNTQAAGPRDAVSLRHEEDNKSNKGLRNTVLSVSLDATFLRLCSSAFYPI
ncbi:unnamed protein product [Rhizophagus irregularis]|nr:unnamed protein product [Rhizophagus irregularis]